MYFLSVVCILRTIYFEGKNYFLLFRLFVEMLFQKQFTQWKENQPEEYCGLLTNLMQSSLSYGMRTTPFVGRNDLSSVFLARDMLLEEKIMLGKL
jgi:hypothetical protein